MAFSLITCALLIAFYGVYFGKMLLQRRRGIQTYQLARSGKPREVQAVQRLVSTATVLVPLAQLLCIAANTYTPFVWVRIAGAILGAAGVIVFSLSVWTMRDSWRAGIPQAGETTLVTDGVYRLSRNPAFLGFDLLYLGVLCLFFHWILFGLTLLAMASLHMQILQEERFLRQAFGAPYLQYQQQVCRYWGRRAQ